MDNLAKHIERFEAYVHRLMTPQEVEEFESQLETDSEFADAFEEYKAVESGIRKHFRSKMKDRLQELDREMGEPKKAPSTALRLLWIASSVAAAIVVGLIVISLFGQSSNEKLAEKYWPAEEGLPVKMSTANRYDKAMNAFKQEQWEKSDKLLREISPVSDTVHYFRGVVKFNLGKFDEATRQFVDIDRESSWYNESQFRLALTYLASGNIDRATKILESIVRSGASYQEQAKALLQEI